MTATLVNATTPEQCATSRLPWRWWAVCALLALLAAFSVVSAHANSDAAWYLYMAGRVLKGSTMYADVVDTNPPLIVWLMLFPAWLARETQSSLAVLNGYLFALALLSIAASGALAARIWGRGQTSTRGLIVAGVAFVALPYVKADFGQREHLVLLAAVPYMFAAVAWLEGRSPGPVAASVIGAIGGLGFVMKPYYVAGWVAVEVVVAIAARGRASWRRPQLVAGGAAVGLYSLAVLLLVPQFLPFARVVHAVYGGALDTSWRYLVALPEVRLWALCAAALAAMRLPAASRRVCAVLFAAHTGFLVAAVVQMKGWTYHLYPARALAVLFLLVFVLSVFEAVPSLVSAVRGGMRGVVIGGAVLLVGWSGQYVREARGRHLDLDVPLVALVKREAPGGRLAQLSMRTIIWPAFPVVVEQRLGWSLRHNSLWFLPGIYEKELRSGVDAVHARAPQAMPPLERRFFDEVVSDLCAAPPDLLLVESAGSPAQPAWPAFDIESYYGQDTRYRMLLRAYERRAPLGPFFVFKRVSSAACR
jgi:hypothetical protein